MVSRIFMAGVIGLASVAAHAITVTVAPSTGSAGTAVTNTIADAIDQVNVASDPDNRIILRSTEGVHTVPPDALWQTNSGKNVTFSAESGQPVVLLQSGGTKFMLAIRAGVNADNQTETLTFNDIAFIPPTGLSYASNIADGIALVGGKAIFNNCVFSFNDGSNGVGSQEGAVAFPGTNCVGDDWFEVSTANDVTFSHCTITGAQDDAMILFGANTAIAKITLDKGTVVANNGGAGIQVAGSNLDLVCDGEQGRVLIANNGLRASTNDTGIKFFTDVMVTLKLHKTDIVGSTNGGLADFEGVPTISITESRLALNNKDSVATVGNFSVIDGSHDSPYSQVITMDHVTIHDTQGASPNNFSVFTADVTGDPTQTYAISDSIFSGAGDTFKMAATGSPAPATTFTAVVTAGPHAIDSPGDLGLGQVNSDPEFVSVSYSIGRSQQNPDFLRPTATAYAAAGSGGSKLRGGAPVSTSSIRDFMIY